MAKAFIYNYHRGACRLGCTHICTLTAWLQRAHDPPHAEVHLLHLRQWYLRPYVQVIQTPVDDTIGK